MLVDQNDRVKKGQLLAVLDDGDLRQQVEVAKAELAAMRAGVDRSAADIDRAQAGTELARIEIERLRALRPSGAVGQLELDQATERRDVAEAELRRARLAKVEAERQVAKADESLRYYQERLTDTRMAAPFNGLIVRRARDAGDVVVPGTTVLELICTEQLWVSAWVDETALGAVAPGQRARVVFRSDPEASYPGTVARLSPQTDREMREFLVDVTVASLPGTWAVGQRAEVYIEVNPSMNDTRVTSGVPASRLGEGGAPGRSRRSECDPARAAGADRGGATGARGRRPGGPGPPVLYALAAFVGAGLVFAGVTDRCGMGLMLAKLRWNRRGTCSGGACSR